ncbi:transcriptional regulator CsgD [Budviciaceae bacterium BWR-B9]|uniref:Transcriptional regulator CsgD n=1 Tax=Limnobaculum allomyrinae TaxID=2791986 RepID=A0ABS1INA9_9GAMM|nr:MULTISPECIES: biofilm master transcriptional regulator CsgD [Limnobaculum]MBK5143243.1 transcriptional regulator CsgD [Limnobaculum allomyrinae]MBV7691131.1 transcriptional regulator CsgD [Limnobaculum sp. M2-1]
MSNEANRSLLLLITQPSLLATALLHQLNTALPINVKLQNIHKPFDEPPTEKVLILFDLMSVDRKLITFWQGVLNQNRDRIKLLLLNTPEDYHFEEIEKWPQISAVFYLSADQEKLIEGISSVLGGEYYFSQRLASHLLNQSRFYHYHHSDNTADLTHREKEILHKLSMGASNLEIARLLFISENTVKTHLYNLFKKISVKNRTQAATWANEHLRR